jgi:hypothetical protein
MFSETDIMVIGGETTFTLPIATVQKVDITRGLCTL